VIVKLIRLAMAQPQLLVEHADAYAELAAAEFGEASTHLKRQALLHAAALCGLGVATVLGGVALMLWAVTPAAQIHTPWLLGGVPLLPAAAALACALAARRARRKEAFPAVRRQVRADIVMLQETCTP
jgi:uncharacterized membrane protein YqjE